MATLLTLKPHVVGVIVDLCFLTLILGALGLSYSGVIRPRGAGFYCDDRSITHTYNGDTISVVSLFIGCLLGPILFILPLEYLKKCKVKANPFLSQLSNTWKNSWRIWKAELTGILMVLVLTEFSKALVSEPRPHFWDTCKPNVTDEACQKGYIVQYSCTSNFTRSQILDSQKSFPSGHTSMSVFTAVFMMWYLGQTVQWPYSFLIKPSLQVVWACFAFFCSLTRITDRRHHWWDVLAGATLGAGVAFVVIQAVSRTIRSEREHPAGENTTDDCLSRDNMAMRDQPAGGGGGGGGGTHNPSKRLSVRRLLSNSSITTTITEDNEINAETIAA